MYQNEKDQEGNNNHLSSAIIAQGAVDFEVSTISVTILVVHVRVL